MKLYKNGIFAKFSFDKKEFKAKKITTKDTYIQPAEYDISGMLLNVPVNQVTGC